MASTSCLRRALPLVAASTLLGCTAELISPENTAGTGRLALLVVSGDNQTAPAGEELPLPLVVKVVQPNGKPMKDQIVNFVVTAGGGTVFAGAAITNSQGIAQERWRLGPVAGQPQAIEARAVSPETGEALVFGTFTARAVVGLLLYAVPGNPETHAYVRENGAPAGAAPGGIMMPDLSPDGRSIVYTRPFTQNLWRADRDGGNETLISSWVAPQYVPQWSWDGTRIVWTRETNWGSWNRQVFRMNADGSAVTQLTCSNGEVPEFSPDGSRIAYQWGQIFIMNADGSGSTRLTNHSVLASNPHFSPSGAQIAYIAEYGSYNEVRVMGLDGSDNHLIYTTTCNPGKVNFSPDGTRLGFSACPEGGLADIYSIRLDGTGLTRITNTPSVDEVLSRWR